MRNASLLFAFLFFQINLIIAQDNLKDKAKPLQKEILPIQNTIKKIQLLSQKDEFNKIINLIKEELKTYPSNQSLYTFLGGAYEKTGDSSQAYKALYYGYFSNPNTNLSRKKIKPMINFIKSKGLKNQKKDSFFYKILKFEEHLDKGQLEDAQTLMNKINSNKNFQAILAIFQKDLKFLQGLPYEADSLMEKTIHEMGIACPEFIYYEQGELLYKGGKYKRAIPLLQNAIKKNPLRRESYAKLGASLLLNGDKRQAEQELLKGLIHFPHYHTIHFFLGNTYWSLNKGIKAKKHFLESAKPGGNSDYQEKSKKALQMIQKGDIYLSPKDIEIIYKGINPTKDPINEVFKKLSDKINEGKTNN